MDSHRPRHSVLSLFDPLTGSPNSELDKENAIGDSSFFHPSRAPFQQPIPTFKRRLIDVGDMTIDEPDMADLLAEEDEFNDQINFDLPGDDDNDTLTFRDMAKAATPKWSGRHFTSLTTPKSSPTPRTPLAEISFKDETTPMARKKPYKRQILTTGASKLSQVDFADARREEVSTPASSSDKPDAVETSYSAPTSTPIIEISLDNSPLSGTAETSSDSRNALGFSVCTLNLPPATESLIADTSNPALISASSSLSSPDVALLSLPSNTRLRPNPGSADHANRRSVDLQSSFQLHLSSSDATFDLLNEKISFLSSKDGSDSFLNNMDIDDSFGEDDLGILKIPHVRVSSDPPAVSQLTEKGSPPFKDRKSIEERTILPLDEVKPVFVRGTPAKQAKAEIITNSPHITVKQSTSSSNTPIRKMLKARTHIMTENPQEIEIIDGIEVTLSEFPREKNTLSTPYSSSVHQVPPRAVPALKIVKRSRILTQPSAATTTHSRRTSISTTAPPPISRNYTRSPPSKLKSITGEDNQADILQPVRGLRRTVLVQPPSSFNPTTTVDGPRRVLISEGPKLGSASNTRTAAHLEQTRPASTSTSNGPRRVVVAGPTAGKPLAAVTKPTTQPNSGLKPPVKYASVAPVSAIPKPVSRLPGSQLPGPPSSRTRFGVPTGVSKGLPGR